MRVQVEQQYGLTHNTNVADYQKNREFISYEIRTRITFDMNKNIIL